MFSPAFVYNAFAITSKKPVLTRDLLIIKIAPIIITALLLNPLNASSTVVAVPSLALIKQTLDVYLKEVSARNQKVKWLCICSDEGIGELS